MLLPFERFFSCSVRSRQMYFFTLPFIFHSSQFFSSRSCSGRCCCCCCLSVMTCVRNLNHFPTFAKWHPWFKRTKTDKMKQKNLNRHSYIHDSFRNISNAITIYICTKAEQIVGGWRMKSAITTQKSCTRQHSNISNKKQIMNVNQSLNATNYD